MKKIYLILMILLFVTVCKESNNTQQQIDELKKETLNTYKPGFGEFMSIIQIHHAKLWFAGINENWKLANFELDEIKENVDAIEKYQKERVESKVLPIINPALESVRNAVKKENKKLFTETFRLLTNTCNQCHQSTNFGFNVIKIPDTPPFTNQDFSVIKK
jgi:hypothetical protein